MDNMESAVIKPGALSLTLQISRIAGVAPLSFKKLRDGYSITVSHFQMAYSYLFLTAFNLAGVVGMILNLKYRTLVDFQSYSATLLIVSERLTCIISCGMGYMAAIRMKNMITHLNIVEKVRTKINYDYNFAKEDSFVMWISFAIVISNLIFTLLETLFTMLRATEYDHITTAKEGTIHNGIRNLTQCYVSVCDVVAKIINADGTYMFLIFTCFSLFSVFDGYRLVLALNNTSTQYGLADILLQSCWCIMIVVRITFFVEPYHRIFTQFSEMKVLLAQLMFQMTALGNDVTIELDIMMKQVILNAPKYCPLGINTLNRSLIIVTLNAIITFLVFLVQLQS